MKKNLFYLSIPFMFLGILSATYTFRNSPQKIPIPVVSEVNTIYEIAKPYIENDRTKGLSIATYKDGKIDFYNFGICSDENAVLPSEQSIYEIGSITKTFTTTVLAQMVSEGKVKYDDPVSKYLPTEIITWSPEVAITLEELATHSSSLPRMPNNFLKSAFFNPGNPYKAYKVADMFDYLKGFKPTPKSDRKVAYSNLGMGLLGHILAGVDELTYEEMIDKRIFQPLGMKDSGIEIGEGKLIQGHNGSGSPTSQWDLPTLAGAGAIRSNTVDMMKYLVANINEKEAYVLTHAPRKDFSDFQKIGLAWISQKNGDLAFTWHNGGTGGFRTFTGFSKTEKVGVVVLANSVQGVDEVGVRILEFLAK